MPNYDFKCKSCGLEFEHRQSMSAEPTTPCPQCKTEAIRVFSPNVNFQFKGSGFYITDYRSDKYNKDAAKDKEVSTPTKSGGEAVTPTTSSKPEPAVKKDSKSL